MKRKEHMGLTLLLAVPICIIFYYFSLDDYVYFIIPMFFTNMLPDILEPATNYLHRKKFHSKRALKILSTYCLISFFILGLMFNFFFYFFFGVIGYISHLLGDWITPMGLPK